MKLGFAALMMLSFMVTTAGADPADPDPDGIGVYFDEGAVEGSWCTTAAPGTQVTAYLCLTRAVDVSGFSAWQGRIESSVPTALTGFVIRGAGINAATAPDFDVSYGTPLPYQLSTVLLEITVDVVWEWPIGLRVWPTAVPGGSDDLPAYASAAVPGTYRTLGYSFSWNPVTKVPNWCAAINDENCLNGPSVGVGDVTWGGLKALYR